MKPYVYRDKKRTIVIYPRSIAVYSKAPIPIEKLEADQEDVKQIVADLKGKGGDLV